ncbi:hypothetical protein, partial [Cronobacter dublinensis]|uniref:hypothetical protein n=1 Tax=Cronobacter dublinensis TaxID=413497 RepID=UPI001319CDDE
MPDQGGRLNASTRLCQTAVFFEAPAQHMLFRGSDGYPDDERLMRVGCQTRVGGLTPPPACARPLFSSKRLRS